MSSTAATAEPSRPFVPGPLPLTDVSAPPTQLAPADATTYAEWFACLAEPTRVRLLHAVAVTVREITSR